jgi:hypothetical protein
VTVVLLLIVAWLVLSVPLAVIVGRFLHRLDESNRATPGRLLKAAGDARPRADEDETGPSAGAATG